ncbi:hypothetical protein, partial [uncultured Duncaniella sp.]|uniref:hypothetical protein n=1 Tax=uncultured Duncaniella sp. TaxID=2768039 RepID=UPI0025B6E0C7
KITRFEMNRVREDMSLFFVLNERAVYLIIEFFRLSVGKDSIDVDIEGCYYCRLLKSAGA